jgi:SOS-response transcriptional repressor LexA
MRGLTKRQADALVLIRRRLNVGQVSPTLQEIADAIGLKAKSGAHRMVETLIARGYLIRVGRGFRALDVPADAPPLAVVDRKVARIVKQTVVLGAISEYPPLDKAKLLTTRKKRTYVVELERDLHHRLRKIARDVDAPPERIIAMALRDFIMERDAA